ncbi:MAG TPA: transglycosylase SLT domain-containing protein [Myxococcaceae bacterium]|nr:transglycosylase SLT domain-containing protein [Myxococcaceae bacterium]
MLPVSRGPRTRPRGRARRLHRAGRWLALWAVVAGPAARGQSERLLEATRLQRASALEMAQAELASCTRKGCAQAPQLSLLVGSLLLSRGEPKEALAQLRRHPAPPLLAPYRSFDIGQALFYTRDFRGAAQAFQEATTAPGAVANRAVARAGEALLRAGEAGQALPLLERALGALGGPELLAARSEARAALGDVAGAQADLHTLMVRYPRSQAAMDADAELRGSSAPAVALTLDERLQRTRVFLDAGDARTALAELDRSETNGLVRDPGARAQVALLRAQAFFALNRVEDAEEALEVAAAGPPATAAEAMLVRARRLLKLDEHGKAMDRLQEISKRFAGEPAAEEADYFLGWLALQEGKLPAAAEALESFERKHPESRRRDEACFFRALAQIRNGNWAEADRALRELQERYPRSGMVPQAKYWRVRVKQLAGGKPVEDYQDILKLYPQTFYGLLAQERLRELGAKPEPIFTERPRLSTKVAQAPELALPRALASAGLWRESAEELRARLGAVHTPEAALRVGTALARVGEAWAAYHLANRLLWGKAYAQKDPGALALLYPRPYVSHVDETARAQGVHSSLLYAIMRRESAFQPDRLSAARARGLMQLMARTATAIAKELQRDPPEPDELYRPELNLDLSAWYVGQLAKRFVHPVLIAAAYNAGPAVTLKWTSELGSLPVDLFVESVPFKETRAYMKQVVADDYLYQAFYGGSDVRRLAMSLPKPASTGIEF